MTTCWDDPENCHGCHYCQEARNTDPMWPLTPAEADDRDMADYLASKGGVLVDGVWEAAR